MRLIEFWQPLILAGISAVWFLCLRGLRKLDHTSLAATRVWIVGVLSVWTIAWLLDSCSRAVAPEVADLIWYATSVISLCPPISVLGARRPGNKAWPAFVLLPMTLVLGWPIFALWFQGSELRGVHLETPQFVAFMLVLVMGVGNYCGTRFTLAAILYGLAVASSVVCVSTVAPAAFADRTFIRPCSVVLMILAAASTKLSVRDENAARFDRLWFDFFDTFGIVWGRRIQDRINYIADREGLGVRLELEGFVWSASKKDVANARVNDRQGDSTNTEASLDHIDFSLSNSEARIEHLMRWLLRRFVDPQWIDARLGSRPEQTISTFIVDS